MSHNLRNNKGIIFAADIENKDQLLKIIRAVDKYIDAIKIGNVALYSNGWRIISDIKSITDRPIIADLKLMDIPEIAQRITVSAIKEGVAGIMICGPVGEEVILECRSITKDRLLFLFTQFTHETGLISDEMADKYVDLAAKYNCDGIQVPGTKPHRIRHIKQAYNDKFIVLSCGIGFQGPKYGSSIAVGSDYEIIGRSIYMAKDPGGEARKAKHSIGLAIENQRPSPE
jgi:orotidine-5'-phosphate decarboxylase